MFDELFELIIKGAFSSREEFNEFAKGASNEEIFSLVEEGAFANIEEFNEIYGGASVKKKGSMESFLVDGSSEPQESDAEPQNLESFLTQQLEETPTQEVQPKYYEEVEAPSEAQIQAAAQADEEAERQSQVRELGGIEKVTQFDEVYDDPETQFEINLENITPELVEGSEGNVVPFLNEIFEQEGFKFEEASPLLDQMLVYPPGGGAPKLFELDANAEIEEKFLNKGLYNPRYARRVNPTLSKNIAKELKKFITDNREEVVPEGEGKMFMTDARRKNAIKANNDREARYKNNTKEYKELNASIEKDAKVFRDLSKEDINADPETRERYESYIDNIKTAEIQREALIEETKVLAEKGVELDVIAANSAEAQALRGDWLGGLYNSFLGGVGDIGAGLAGTGIDIATNFQKNAGSGLSDEQFKKEIIRVSKENDIELPENAEEMTLEGLEKAMGGRAYSRDPYSYNEPTPYLQAFNKVLDISRKGKKYFDDYEGAKKGRARSVFSRTADYADLGEGTLSAIRKSVVDAFGDKNTTEQWAELKSEGFLGGAVLGLSRSLPAMSAALLGGVPGVLALAAQASDSIYKEMENDPDFADISESEKMKVALPIALAVGVLERVGLRNAIKGTGMLNKLVSKAIGKSTARTTAKEFTDLVETEIASGVAKGLIRAGAAGAAEFETGFLQEIADVTVKDMYNESKGKKMFDTPDTFLDMISDAVYAGAQEAVGGFILGSPRAVQSAISGNTVLSDEEFQSLEAFVQNPELLNVYEDRLKSKVASGLMTVKGANNEFVALGKGIGILRDTEAFFKGDVPVSEKSEAFTLVSRKKQLQQEIEKADPELVTPQREELKKVKERLTEISKIDVIQEQSTETVDAREPAEGRPTMGDTVPGTGTITEPTEVEADKTKVEEEVVYHGSPTPIEGGVLKKGQSGAIFLTPNKEYAKQYSADVVGEVTTTTISKEKKDNLFDLRNPEHIERLKQGYLKNNEDLEIEYKTEEAALRDYENSLRSMREASEGRDGINDWASGSQFIEPMENAGFDGALFAERPAGVLDENIVVSYALFAKELPIAEVKADKTKVEEEATTEQEVEDFEAFIESDNAQFQLSQGTTDEKTKKKQTREALKVFKELDNQPLAEDAVVVEQPDVAPTPVKVEDNNRLANKIKRFKMIDIIGRKLNLLMADKLKVELKDPTKPYSKETNPYKMMGGNFFPLMEDMFGKIAWASITDAATTKIIKGAMDGDYSVVYNMGNGGIMSNIIIAEMLDEKIPEGRKAEFYELIKDRVNESGLKDVKPAKKHIKNSTDMNSFFKLLQKEKVETRAAVMELILPEDLDIKSKSTLEQELQGLGISRDSLIEETSESFAKDLPTGAITMVLEITNKDGIKVSELKKQLDKKLKNKEITENQYDKGIEDIIASAKMTQEQQEAEGIPIHNNYPYYIRGRSVAMMEETVPFYKVIKQYSDTIQRRVVGKEKKKARGIKEGLKDFEERVYTTINKAKGDKVSTVDKKAAIQEVLDSEDFKKLKVKDRKVIKPLLEQALELNSKDKIKDVLAVAETPLAKMTRYSAAFAESSAMTSAMTTSSTAYAISDYVASDYEIFLNRISKSFPNVEVVSTQEEFDALIEDVYAKSLSTKNQTIYGAVYRGKLYLNPRQRNFNTPIHEYGHIWLNTAKQERPDLYKKGMELITKDNTYIEQIKNNPDYIRVVKRMKEGGATDAEIDSYIKEEALATAIGDKGEAFVNASVKRNFKEWLTDLFKNIQKLFGISTYTSEQLQDITLDEFLQGITVDILSGKEVFKDASTKAFSDALQLMTSTETKGLTPTQIIQVGRDNNFKDSTIKDYLVRIKGNKVKDIDALLSTPVDLFSDKFPESFNNIEGGAAKGTRLYDRVNKFANKLIQKNNKNTRLTDLELNAKVEEFAREQKKDYITNSQLNDKVREFRETLEAKNSKRKKPLTASQINAKVKDFRESEIIAREETNSIIQENITEFKDNLTKSNNRKAPLLSKQDIVDKTIEFLEAQPEYIAEADTYTVGSEKKGTKETKRRKGLSTQQASMLSDLQKVIGIRPSQDMAAKISKARRMITQRKKGARDLNAIKTELRNFIRKTIPKATYTKPEVINLIRKVSIANEANIDNIYNEVLEFTTKKNVEILSKNINKILSETFTKVESGRLKGVKIDVASKERIDAIKKMLATEEMSAEDILNANVLLMAEYVELQQNPEPTIESQSKMSDIQIAMEYNNSLLMEDTDINKVTSLDLVSTSLDELIEDGVTRLDRELQMASQKYKETFEYIYEDVVGERIDMDSPDAKTRLDKAKRNRATQAERERVAGNTKRALNIIGRGISNVFTSAEALDGLMDKISSLPGEMFGGRTQEIVTDRIDAASREFKGKKMYVSEEIRKKLEKIYGKKWKEEAIKNTKTIGTEIYRDPQEIADAKKAYEANPNSATKESLANAILNNELILSPNQMYYYYNQFKDPANLGAFSNMFSLESISKNDTQEEKDRKNGINEANAKRVMDEVTSKLTPELKTFADWQVNEFFPELYERYNAVYKKIYRTNMPWNEFYAGRIYREGVELEPMDLLAGLNSSSMSAVTAASSKMRQANNLEIAKMDGTNALANYLEDMEYFAAYAEVIRDVNKLFTNEYISDAITSMHGKTTMNLINDSIKKIANRGVANTTADSLVNGMNTIFATSRIGLSPVIAVKQLTSVFTFANDIGIGNWASYAGKSIPEMSKTWKEIIENSIYLKDRYGEQILRNIESYSESSMKDFVPNPTKEFIMNVILYNVKWGDRTAIMVGGMPNYNFYKAQYKKNNPNATEQDAIDYAIVKFERDTKRTQQSGDLTDRDVFQTGSPLVRAANMFLTTPKQYLRKEIQAVRSLSRKVSQWDKNAGKGTVTENIRTFLMYHIFMPVLFQYISAGLPGLFADWEDEDEQDLLRAGILGNLNALFIIGEVITGIGDYLTHKPWAGEGTKSVGLLNLSSQLFKKAKKAREAKDLEKKSKYWNDFIFESATITGLPVPTLTRLFENITDIGSDNDMGKDVLRLLNFSKYQIDGPTKTKAKAKTKAKDDSVSTTPGYFRRSTKKKRRSRKRSSGRRRAFID